MEPKGSLPNSQELSNCPCPEPDQSSENDPFLFMLHTHSRLGLPNGLIPAGFPTNNLYTFLKNTIFWDVTLFGSCKNRRFGKIGACIIRVARIGELGTVDSYC
jgi:hypothetical protein